MQDLITMTTVTPGAKFTDITTNAFTAANPCPPEVTYLEKVSWLALYRAGQRCNEEQPACLLALLCCGANGFDIVWNTQCVMPHS